VYLALGIDYHVYDESKGDEVNDIHKWPPFIMKLQDGCDYAHLISNFVLDNPEDFGGLKKMHSQKLLGKLNKMGIANLNRQHQTSLIYYFQYDG